MEAQKTDFSNIKEELWVNNKLYLKSILRIKTANTAYRRTAFIKSKTTVSNEYTKSVTFSDKFKRPLHVIIEVEPIIYEEKKSSSNKIKSKGCTCMIFWLLILSFIFYVIVVAQTLELRSFEVIKLKN